MALLSTKFSSFLQTFFQFDNQLVQFVLWQLDFKKGASLLCVWRKKAATSYTSYKKAPYAARQRPPTCGTVHNVLHDKVRRLYYIERGPFAKNWGQMLFPSCFCLNFPDPAGLHAGPARNKAPAASPRVTRTPFSLRALAPPSSRLAGCQAKT